MTFDARITENSIMKTKIRVIAPFTAVYSNVRKPELKRTVRHEPGETLAVDLMDTTPTQRFCYTWYREMNSYTQGWFAMTQPGTRECVEIV